MSQQLPQSIVIDKKVYNLYKCRIPESDKIIPNWWQYWYSENEQTCPPEVLYKNDDRVYYNFLVACEETEEAAINDLLDRINHIHYE